MRILLYITIISLGAFLSYRGLSSEKVLEKLDRIQYLCLLFLLFVMGVKIGINSEIIKAFYKLGYSAVVISFFSIIFSILGVKIVSKFIKSSKKKVEKI
ncbi:MAG: hypothetical protein PWQ37_1258 [Candidatus Petromonas sp.]|jgi:uncharacterized membrane protein YbjE (DUF340 family)|nr:hypothetical protein [Candidatus Petromonas sp.]